MLSWIFAEQNSITFNCGRSFSAEGFFEIIVDVLKMIFDGVMSL